MGKGAKIRAFQKRAADICQALARADDVFVSLPLHSVFQRYTDPRDHIPRKFCDSLCHISFFCRSIVITNPPSRDLGGGGVNFRLWKKKSRGNAKKRGIRWHFSHSAALLISHLCVKVVLWRIDVTSCLGVPLLLGHVLSLTVWFSAASLRTSWGGHKW